MIPLHFLLLSACSAVSANLLSRPSSLVYKAPTCKTRQSCLFFMDDLRFEMCSCPGKNDCGTHQAVHQEILYNFCSDPLLPPCTVGQHSVTVEGLQTTLHCVCEAPMVERKKVSSPRKSEFVCELQKPAMSAKMRKLMRGWKRRASRISKTQASVLRRKLTNDVRCNQKEEGCI